MHTEESSGKSAEKGKRKGLCVHMAYMKAVFDKVNRKEK